MIQYTDETRNVIEYYEYDYQGRVTKISLSSGGTTDYITFTYDDEEGYLTELSTSISNTTLLSKYFHNESPLFPGLYDKSTYNLNSTGQLTVDWLYDTATGMDPLTRLQKLQYSFQGQQNDSISINFVYQNYTSRISKITVDTPSATVLKKIQYDYTYDSLGNITEEKYLEMAQGSSVFVDIITRKYIYDDLNQLIQESVHNSQVDCNNSANIQSCYVKTYQYDKLGNLTLQQTFKYKNTNSLVRNISSPTPYANGNMILLYNGNKQYQDVYIIPVGGTINLSFSYLEYFTFPPEPIYPVTTTINTSNVNVNVPGLYLITGTAHDPGYSFTLDFGIVVSVGNVTSGELVNQKSFTYHTDWKDQLSSYTVIENGITKTSTITYDDPYDSTKFQGNPTKITNFFYEGTKYNHANLTWEGRQLVNIKIYSSSNDTVKVKELWYSYNDQGIRVSKMIDTTGNDIPNIKYEYVVVGDQVLTEIVTEWNSHTWQWEEIYQINYLYEHDGSAIGFQYFTPSSSPSTYLYIRNIQGDVTKIVDQNGNILVRYEYDAYGNILSMTGSHENTLGKHNSLTYRSYKYDREINLYYLNSRYYNPEIGRFINSDGLLGPVGNILGHNMYAYTQNNPVMFVDPSGKVPIPLVFALVTAFFIGSVASAISQGQQYGWDNINLFQIMIDGAIASLAVAIAATGIGVWGSAGIGSLLGMGQYWLSSSIHNVDITLQGLIVSGLVGFASGALSGAGARNITLINKQLAKDGVAKTGIKALTTAANRMMNGEISKRGFMATFNLYGKSVMKSIQDATPGIIANKFTGNALKVFILTAISPVGVYYGNQIVIDVR